MTNVCEVLFDSDDSLLLLQRFQDVEEKIRQLSLDIEEGKMKLEQCLGWSENDTTILREFDTLKYDVKYVLQHMRDERVSTDGVAIVVDRLECEYKKDIPSMQTDISFVRSDVFISMI
jgi:hypothetical protein